MSERRLPGSADPALETCRLDKWLWAARFYKTRDHAAEAVSGGKVSLNGGRVKPARQVRIGDVLVIHRAPYEFRITVTGLSLQRGPAEAAHTLYAEDEASLAARQALRQQLKDEGVSARDRPRRPDKRGRRLIHQFRGR